MKASIDLEEIVRADEGQYEISFRVTTGDCNFSAASLFDVTFRVRNRDGGEDFESMRLAGWDSGESGKPSFTITRKGALYSGVEVLDVVKIEDPDFICYDDENNEGDSLLFNAGQEKFPVTTLISSSTTAIADPNTIAAVQELVAKTVLASDTRLTFVRVEDVVLQWGEASIDLDAIKTIPSKVEESSVVWINETDEEEEHDELVRITTKRTETLESSKKVISSNEHKVGLSFSPVDAAKINADIIYKNQFELSSAQTQSYSEEVVKESRQKFVVPRRSKFTLHSLVVKGFVIAPVAGRVSIDALVTWELKTDFNRRSFVSLWLSRQGLLPNPLDRIVEYKGTLVSESFQSSTFRRKVEPLSEADTLLKILGNGGWVSSG